MSTPTWSATGGKTGSNNVRSKLRPHGRLSALQCRGVSQHIRQSSWSRFTTVAAGIHPKQLHEHYRRRRPRIRRRRRRPRRPTTLPPAAYRTPTTAQAPARQPRPPASSTPSPTLPPWPIAPAAQLNATTANGAIVPVQFINTLGNILQACVNSNGGGTDLPPAHHHHDHQRPATPPTTERLAASSSPTPATPLDGTASGTLRSAWQHSFGSPEPRQAAYRAARRCSTPTAPPAHAEPPPHATCIFNLGTSGRRLSDFHDRRSERLDARHLLSQGRASPPRANGCRLRR